MKKEKILYDRIFDKLEGLFDKVIFEKSRGYQSNPKPKISDVDQIIRHYSSKCAVISLGAALKPGQWAVISAVPEVVLGMKKQSEMIYDISAAYCKDSIMSKELLAGILLKSVSDDSYGLLKYKDGRYILYENQRLFDSAVYKIAKRIARMLYRSALVRWLPGFRTVSNVLISGEVTRKIGLAACDVFSKEIEIVKPDDNALGINGNLNEDDEYLSVSKDGYLVKN